MNIVPQDQARHLFNAQLQRAKELCNSASRLVPHDRRTAWALYVLAIEETMEAYQVLLLELDVIAEEDYRTLHCGNLHQTRQQLAYGLILVIQRVESILGPPKRVRDRYSGMNQAKKAVIAARKDTKFLTDTLGNLPYWEKKKQQCLYVDWTVSGPSDPHITKDDLTEIAHVIGFLIRYVALINARAVRRTIRRHAREFKDLAVSAVASLGLAYSANEPRRANT